MPTTVSERCYRVTGIMGISDGEMGPLEANPPTSMRQEKGDAGEKLQTPEAASQVSSGGSRYPSNG